MKHSKLNWLNFLYKTSLALGLLSLLLFVIGSILFRQTQKNRIQAAQEKSKREAVLATLEIERELREFSQPLSLLSQELSTGELSTTELQTRLEREITENPQIANLGVAYNLFSYDQDKMFYAPTYIRAKDAIKLIQLEDIYDYTSPEYGWFRDVFIQGAHWGEPYSWPKNDFIDEVLFGYYQPFYQPEEGSTAESLQGVIYAEYSYTHLEDIMDSLNLGKTGYGFLISQQGKFIAHPNPETVRINSNITDILQQQPDKNKLINTINKVFEEQIVETEFIDQITGKKSWVYLRPLDLNDWVVGIVFFEEEVLVDSKTKRQWLIQLSLLFMSSLFFLGVLLFWSKKFNLKKLWLLSIFSSALFIAEIGFIWQLLLENYNYLANRLVLLNKTELEKILSPHIKLSEQLHQKTPPKIPTGFFLQSVKFSEGHEIFITGYIWQKYLLGTYDELSRGFILPDAVNANDLEISEVYNYEKDGFEVIGWYVEATLHQDFEFSKYPFDRKDIEIQIWHEDLETQVILIPDLDSYELINPKIKPGINQDIILDGWTLEGSFFEYKFRKFNTNFGFKQGFSRNNAPSLYFTIAVRRNVFAPLISKLVALVCVVALLFAMLLILNRERAMEILGVAAGLIFILIIDQISVREAIAAQGLIYFDYFYFVIYL
ncbi:cache domain-containing protein [Xenococcus sp. PCC 7305]|uniref:Cache 3/Cache 2 fusion domain-containing protein n=1 Tax=Xenococcus sp. PCC 7305 TaxID=102125 RepID=UPI0002AC8441|nr:Cache 3/Cache 2 fusion domain-containing protein [Xenococcus sp. PCC 7305]ELS00654.1 cache domain-containing protein [Xenococcus sp. PCC 7305]